MGRVINTNSAGKTRHYNRRTVAELLQRLGQQSALNEDSQDMAAAIVFALREIYQTAEEAAQAWEKRDYWLKAERFLQEWGWSKELAANLEDVLREKAWELLPGLLLALYPYFSDITIKSYTRDTAVWQGAYQRLLTMEPNTLAY